MKNILILGAGQSSAFLIKYLLDEAEENNWFVTVCDIDKAEAQRKINGSPRGDAVEFDVNDETMRHTQIKNADVVINLLAPVFQYLIALDCLNYKKHLITASYTDPKVAGLSKDAVRKDIIILNEMGLDPGIDHMMAMSLIDKVRTNGGEIESFISYGSGLPEPGIETNPFNYCITWNPRNIVMAGESGALYMEEGKIKILSHRNVFRRTWRVNVEGIGQLEAYPNRNSMIYLDVFKLPNVHTMIRGTLRYPGWSETWNQIVKLGLPNEIMKIPHICEMTYAEFLEIFLPLHATGANLTQRVANYLGISPTGKIMDNMIWLDLFSDKKIGGRCQTAADVMVELLSKKLPLPKGKRDVVILVHELIAAFENGRKEKYVSSLVDFGEVDGITAIAKTVGAPAAIAAKLILNKELNIRGTQIPTHPAIFNRALEELEKLGLNFKEKTEDVSNI